MLPASAGPRVDPEEVPLPAAGAEATSGEAGPGPGVRRPDGEMTTLRAFTCDDLFRFNNM